MLSSYKSFKRGLLELRGYIQGLDLAEALLTAHVELPGSSLAEQRLLRLQHHNQSSANRRRFEYNTIIISLYGYFEQYVEGLVKNFVQYISSIVPTFQELPEAINKNHLQLSMDLIRNVEQQRFRTTIQIDDVLERLLSCTKNDGVYRLNSEAFAMHSANFRAAEVDTIFGKVGILSVSRRVVDCKAFADHLAIIYPRIDTKAIKNPQEAFYLHHLNDLADRRNEVAHGAPCQLLTNDILLEYVTFFEAYGEALYDLAIAGTLASEIKYKAKQLPAPLAVFGSDKVGFKLEGVSVYVGDLIIAETKDKSKPFMVSEILEIQIDHVPCVALKTQEPMDVSLRVSFNAKQVHNFYLLPRREAPTYNKIGTEEFKEEEPKDGYFLGSDDEH